MEYKELQKFVSKVYRPGMIYNRQFSYGGYTMATDGYRFAGIKDNNQEDTEGYYLLYNIFIEAIEKIKEKSKMIFRREYQKEIEKMYKEIRQRDKHIYKKNLILGINFKDETFVLFSRSKNMRPSEEIKTHQYFNYQYFCEALEFFPRYKQIELLHESRKYGQVVFNSEERQLILMPIAFRERR